MPSANFSKGKSAWVRLKACQSEPLNLRKRGDCRGQSTAAPAWSVSCRWWMSTPTRSPRWMSPSGSAGGTWVARSRRSTGRQVVPPPPCFGSPPLSTAWGIERGHGLGPRALSKQPKSMHANASQNASMREEILWRAKGLVMPVRIVQMGLERDMFVGSWQIGGGYPV